MDTSMKQFICISPWALLILVTLTMYVDLVNLFTGLERCQGPGTIALQLILSLLVLLAASVIHLCSYSVQVITRHTYFNMLMI